MLLKAGRAELPRVPGPCSMLPVPGMCWWWPEFEDEATLGAGRDEDGEDEPGKRHPDIEHLFPDSFQRRPVPLAHPPHLSTSTCPNAFGRLREEEGDINHYLCEKEGEQGKEKLKAKDYLCFSCTGVCFFTRFDANVSFSMLHVSFLF